MALEQRRPVPRLTKHNRSNILTQPRLQFATKLFAKYFGQASGWFSIYLYPLTGRFQTLFQPFPFHPSPLLHTIFPSINRNSLVDPSDGSAQLFELEFLQIVKKQQSARLELRVGQGTFRQGLMRSKARELSRLKTSWLSCLDCPTLFLCTFYGSVCVCVWVWREILLLLCILNEERRTLSFPSYWNVLCGGDLEFKFVKRGSFVSSNWYFWYKSWENFIILQVLQMLSMEVFFTMIILSWEIFLK